MKIEIDFGKHIEKAKEIVNSLIEEAENTRISIEVKKESKAESEGEE